MPSKIERIKEEALPFHNKHRKYLSNNTMKKGRDSWSIQKLIKNDIYNVLKKLSHYCTTAVCTFLVCLLIYH